VDPNKQTSLVFKWLVQLKRAFKNWAIFRQSIILTIQQPDKMVQFLNGSYQPFENWKLNTKFDNAMVQEFECSVFRLKIKCLLDIFKMSYFEHTLMS
jgi:hypothetical protein